MSDVEWLEQAGVIMICTSLDFPELPLRAHRDRSAYKLYMADTGLLIAQLDKDAQGIRRPKVASRSEVA